MTFSCDAPPILGNSGSAAWMAANSHSFAASNWKPEHLKDLFRDRFVNGLMPCELTIFGGSSNSLRVQNMLVKKASYSIRS